MTIPSIIRRIKKYKPTTPEEFRLVGLRLKNIGCGVFREVYQIVGSVLVVKFPNDPSSKIHTTIEIRKIERLKKFKALRPHIPTVYYHDRKSGIVVMRYYEETVCYAHAFNLLGKLIKSLTGVNMWDLSEDNMRTYGNSLKFIDLGY